MLTVFYDADCGLCTRTRQLVESLDWLGKMRWVSNRSAEAAASGIPREALDHAVFVQDDRGQRAGFEAVQQMVARLPLTWFVAAWVIARRPWTAFLFAFLFSPLARPAGDPVYDWIARHRYQFPGSTCDNQGK